MSLPIGVLFFKFLLVQHTSSSVSRASLAALNSQQLSCVLPLKVQVQVVAAIPLATSSSKQAIVLSMYYTGR